jgi:broad specificity phosphatase PhoE
MASWYLVRHGETAWNVEERIQGHSDIPLHEFGRSEAASAGRSLTDTPFTAAYTSDLGRSEETALIILEAQAGPTPGLSTTPLLREVSYGVFEGMTWAEIREADPRMRDRAFVHDLDFAPEDGESFRQLLERGGGLANDLSAKHVSEDILVVGHGGSLRALAVRILGLPDEAFWKLRGLRNASISVVQQDGHSPSLVTWNGTAHLP